MGTVDDDANGGDASPQLVEGLLGLPVASVCCGGQHAAVLTRDGDVYTWGRGGFGRLGHGDVRSLKAPRLVRGGLAGVVCAQVACGFAYTAAVSRDGALYTWGRGRTGAWAWATSTTATSRPWSRRSGRGARSGA